jgi:quercetin dioxygenase-like cupin family protein
MKLLIRSVVALMLFVSAAFLTTATATATPSKDISARTLADVEIPAELIPFIPAGVHVVAREITIAPGGTTGWHYHDGPVVGIVAAGTLTHPGPDCVPEIFHTGDFINEPNGVANTHVGRNLGTTPVVLYVVYLQPLGDPLFEDAPAPACDAPATAG